MADSLRLDKFLWFARIVKTRAPWPRPWPDEGRIRIGGRVIDRAHAPVRVGDVLSFAQRRVRVLRVEALPARRGPPAEARALHCDAARRGFRPAGKC